MHDATPAAGFACADLTTFTRLDELGLAVTGQRLEPDRAVLACRVVEPDQWCRRCGCEGTPRDTVVRRLAHEPFGWRPTTVLVTIRRYGAPAVGRCGDKTVPGRRAAGEAVPSGAAVGAGRHRVSALHDPRVADGLGVAWNTANDAVLAGGNAGTAPQADSTVARHLSCSDRGETFSSSRLRDRFSGTMEPWGPST